MFKFILILVAKGQSAQNSDAKIKEISFCIEAKDSIWSEIKAEYHADFLAAVNKMDIVSIQPA